MRGHLSTTFAAVLVHYVLTVDRQTAIRIDDYAKQPRVRLDTRSTAVIDVVLQELTSAHSILRGKFLLVSVSKPSVPARLDLPLPWHRHTLSSSVSIEVFVLAKGNKGWTQIMNIILCTFTVLLV